MKHVKQTNREDISSLCESCTRVFESKIFTEVRIVGAICSNIDNTYKPLDESYTVLE